MTQNRGYDVKFASRVVFNPFELIWKTRECCFLQTIVHYYKLPRRWWWSLGCLDRLEWIIATTKGPRSGSKIVFFLREQVAKLSSTLWTIAINLGASTNMWRREYRSKLYLSALWSWNKAYICVFWVITQWLINSLAKCDIYICTIVHDSIYLSWFIEI